MSNTRLIAVVCFVYIKQFIRNLVTESLLTFIVIRSVSLSSNVYHIKYLFMLLCYKKEKRYNLIDKGLLRD